jgi:hypothetical protein
MKNFTLRLIQIAWVAETIIILIFTMAAIVKLKAEQVNLWLQFIPTFTILIGAQGAAAGGGPLMADWIKTAEKKRSGK